MSYQVGSVCVGSPESAWSLIAARESGTVVQHGGDAYVVSADVVEGGVSYTLARVDGQGSPLVLQPALTLQECQLPDAEYGAWLAGLVVLVWAVAYGFRVVARLLWSSIGGNDDS